jgi:cytochrome c-type biogenesis protein
MVSSTGWLYFGSVWLAGVISFLSPCVLPIMPGYLAYLTGRATGRDPCSLERRQVFAHGLAFVLGFSLMFILLGATASVLGRLLLHYRVLLVRIGGMLMIAFGLQMAGFIRLPLLEYGWRPQAKPDPRLGYASSILMGFFFAAGWTPCIGMILGSVLTLAAYQASLPQGVLLLAIYSFGLSLPFLLIALLLDRISGWMCTLTRISRYISIVAGLILVLFGLLFAMNRLSILTQWLPSWEIGV